jgi:hypothetical protein
MPAPMMAIAGCRPSLAQDEFPFAVAFMLDLG